MTNYLSIMALYEYIWRGSNNELRSKTRFLDIDTSDGVNVEDVPSWNYDGSSTGQAQGNDSEVMLIPVAVFNDPFRPVDDGENYLILCEITRHDGSLLPNSTWTYADNIFKQEPGSEPWFGIEQEYFIMNNKTGKPLGFPEDNDAQPNSQGQYYCSVGSKNAFGRELADEHLNFCIEAGIKISGMNAEVAPGQWEYQVGPCEGIECGNHMWVSRYILEKLTEQYDYTVCWDPKPLEGDWNGSGCHTNFSTILMREGNGVTADQEAISKKKGGNKRQMNGLDYIYKAIEKLESKHEEHMDIYGENNNLRMTGKHETAEYNKFSYGVANRSASVRICNETFKNKEGYFEDRRPASNMDPYLVSAKLFETCHLN